LRRIELTEINLLRLHQNLRIIRGIKHPWAAPVVKPKVEGNYATMVMSVVVVNTGLMVVERRIAVVTKQVRETGAGYDQGTGSSPTSRKRKVP